jgi:hypothetical protein
MSDVDSFIPHLFAALVRKERARFIRALRGPWQADKARGATLGNPKIDEAREKAAAEIVDRADRRVANVIPIVRQIQRTGATSLRQIAEARDLGSQRDGARLASEHGASLTATIRSVRPRRPGRGSSAGVGPLSRSRTREDPRPSL